MPSRLLLVLTGLAVPVACHAEEPAKPEPTAVAGRLWAVMDLIQDHHIEPPARQQMCLGAVRGLLSAGGAPVSPDLSRSASAVQTREQFAELVQRSWPQTAPKEPEKAMLRGLLQVVPGSPLLLTAADLKSAGPVPPGELYVGTGIQVRYSPADKLVQIILPFRRGPARRAGARPNDLIVAVDGVSMAGKDLETVVRTLRGKEGTSVSMAVRQPGATETRTLTMIREIVPFDTLFGYRRLSEDQWDYHVSPNSMVGYVRVAELTGSTVNELRHLERRLRDDGIKALVLDMRFSSPTDLRHAAQVTDCLLDGGALWRIRDNRGRAQEAKAAPDCVFRDWPIAVLINGKTGRMGPSLLAAALKDNGRAILVGEAVQDDGYLNSVIPLPGGHGALRLPTARLERAVAQKPDEDHPGGWSVKPDHPVGMSESEQQALAKWQSDKLLPELPPGTTDAPPTDPQLARAVELLTEALRKRHP